MEGITSLAKPQRWRRQQGGGRKEGGGPLRIDLNTETIDLPTLRAHQVGRSCPWRRLQTPLGSIAVPAGQLDR